MSALRGGTYELILRGRNSVGLSHPSEMLTQMVEGSRGLPERTPTPDANPGRRETASLLDAAGGQWQ